MLIERRDQTVEASGANSGLIDHTMGAAVAANADRQMAALGLAGELGMKDASEVRNQLVSILTGDKAIVAIARNCWSQSGTSSLRVAPTVSLTC